MNKRIGLLSILLLFSIVAFAGGLLTNTNQTVHFLRNPARGASTEIDAAYTNPAGLAFLPEKGFYFSVTNQSAFQTRTITSTYPAFVGYGGNQTKEYEGVASVGFIPSIQGAYKIGDWVVSANFAVSGGGGKATFNSGLPSFESQISEIPALVNQLGAVVGGLMPGTTLTANQYSVDAYMEGSSIIYGAQLGGTYSINEHFAAYGGFRMNFVNNSYVGHLRNIQINPTSNNPMLGTGAMVSATNYFQQLAAMIPDEYAEYKQMLGAAAASTADKNLDCDQSGWGVTPIIGVHYHWGRLDIGAKYEFKTSLNVENKTKVDDTGLFKDGVNTPHDIPALFTIGAQYAIIDPVTVSVGYHHFFDSDAKMANNKQEYIDGGINEYLAGVEWRINRLFTVSCGGQITRTGVSDGYQSNLSYHLHSKSLCVGAAANITSNVRVNVGYLYTFYDDWTVNLANYSGSTGGLPGTDTYGRDNKTFGVGVDFHF